MNIKRLRDELEELKQNDKYEIYESNRMYNQAVEDILNIIKEKYDARTNTPK